MNNDITLSNTMPQSFDHLPTMKRWLMKSLAKIHYGTLYVHLDGDCYTCGNDESMVAHLHIHNALKMTLRCVTKGDLGFAESYIEEEWSSPDLTQVLKLFLKNRGKLGSTYGGKSMLRVAANMYHKLRKNSLKGSRKNIQYHYDLGNDFYELWLDKSMNRTNHWKKRKSQNTNALLMRSNPIKATLF